MAWGSAPCNPLKSPNEISRLPAPKPKQEAPSVTGARYELRRSGPEAVPARAPPCLRREDKDRNTAAKPAVSLRSKSARTIRSGSLRSRQHIRTPEPLRSPRTGLRLLNTNQVQRPARFARRGGIAPRRSDRETHRDRAARGKATRSESDRRVPASGGAKKIRYAISAPQGRLHPVAILFAPKKKFRRRSASRPRGARLRALGRALTV